MDVTNDDMVLTKSYEIMLPTLTLQNNCYEDLYLRKISFIQKNYLENVLGKRDYLRKNTVY